MRVAEHATHGGDAIGDVQEQHIIEVALRQLTKTAGRWHVAMHFGEASKQILFTADNSGGLFRHADSGAYGSDPITFNQHGLAWQQLPAAAIKVDYSHISNSC